MIARVVVVALACVVMGACASVRSPPTSRASSLDEARAFFEANVARANVDTVAAADDYADDASVRIVTWSPDGSLKRILLTGKSLKAVARTLSATPTNTSDYACTYRAVPNEEQAPRAGLVYVECMRHAREKDYVAWAAFLVGKDDAGAWRFYSDTTWTCAVPSACTRDLPWRKMACAEGKHWREGDGQLTLESCTR